MSLMPSPGSIAWEEQQKLKAKILDDLADIKEKMAAQEFYLSEDVRRDLTELVRAVERRMLADWVEGGTYMLIEVILRQLKTPTQPIYEEVIGRTTNP
jgi:hypothetical protein